MTTLTGRWWAPLRPTTEPDQVALALMKPDGNPQADFRAALLGMHRAGAAACEAVAKGAVPSEQGLLAALAHCRAAISEPAVDNISKSLEPTYAGLLVRDLFDDAEAASLALYRTCVTKGIAPPLAASRVGAVFGVPSRELGKYAALASDPRVNPVALTDAADRALLTYVEKLAVSEIGEAKEEVSKAPAVLEQTDTETRWDPREHPRDNAGRFSRADTAVAEAPARPMTMMERLRQQLGLGTESAPEVVVAPEQAPAPVRTERRTRKTRKVVRRVSAAPKAAPQQQTETAAEQKLGTAPLSSKKLSLAQVKSLNLTLEKVNAESVAAADLQFSHREPLHLPKDLLTLPSPNDHRYYGTIYEPIALHVTAREGQELRTRAAGPRGEKVFRIGWLMDAAGTAEIQGTRQAHANREYMEETALHDPDVVQDYAEPDVDTIHPDDLLHAMFIGQEKEYIEQRKDELAGLLQVEGLEGINLAERTNIIVAKDYHAAPDSNELMLVHLNVHEGVDRAAYRPRPVVDEFVIEDEAVGMIEQAPAKRHPQIHLDPNQAYVVSAKPEILYDQRRSVFVHRWRLRAVDDEQAQEIAQKGRFGKALAPVEAVEFEQVHPRDAHGRFTTTIERPSLVAPSALMQRLMAETDAQTDATGHRPSRRTRKVRSRVRRVQATRGQLEQRQSTPGAQQVKVTSQRLSSTKLSAAQLRQHKLKMAKLEKAIQSQALATSMPKLHESKTYKVMDLGEFRTMIGDHARGTFKVPPADEALLVGEGAIQLHEGYDFSGDTVLNELRHRVGKTVWDQDDVDLRFLGERPVATDDDVFKVAGWINSVFDRDPSIAFVEATPVMGGGGADVYRFEANRTPIEPLVVVEMDDDVDYDTDSLRLVKVGEYTSRQIVQVPSPMRVGHVEDSPDQLMNVRVSFYRASVSHYRAGRE